MGRSVVVAASVACAACSALLGFGDIERVDRVDPLVDGSLPTSDDASPPSVDAEANANADAGPERVSRACPAPAATYLPTWSSPPERPKPCSSADVVTFVKNEQRSFESQKAAIAATNAACAACVFTREDDRTWGPITHTNDDRIFVGYPLCYRASGASDSCASSAHALEWCIQKVCNVCTTGLTLTECRQGAESGVCKAGVDATLASCAGFEQILGKTCARSGDVVGVLCGGT